MDRSWKKRPKIREREDGNGMFENTSKKLPGYSGGSYETEKEAVAVYLIIPRKSKDSKGGSWEEKGPVINRKGRGSFRWHRTGGKQQVRRVCYGKSKRAAGAGPRPVYTTIDK